MGQRRARVFLHRARRGRLANVWARRWDFLGDSSAALRCATHARCVSTAEGVRDKQSVGGGGNSV